MLHYLSISRWKYKTHYGICITSLFLYILSRDKNGADLQDNYALCCSMLWACRSVLFVTSCIGCNHAARSTKNYLCYIFRVLLYIFWKMCFINKINSQKQCIDNYFSGTFDKFQDTWSIPKLFQDWNLCFLISKHFQEFQDSGTLSIGTISVASWWCNMIIKIW